MTPNCGLYLNDDVRVAVGTLDGLQGAQLRAFTGLDQRAYEAAFPAMAQYVRDVHARAALPAADDPGALALPLAALRPGADEASATVLVAADGRALTRALRVAGKVEPLFVETVNGLPAALVDTG